jgi:alpha-mannosidase
MIRGPDGMEVPHEILDSKDGLDRELLFIARRMPPLGYQVFTALEGKGTRFETDMSGNGSTIENRHLKVEVNPQTGNIKGILDKRTGRQVLAEGSEGNILELHENLPSYWDAWNIGYTGRSWTVDRPDSIELVEGPVRTLLRIKKSFLGLSKANRAPTEGFPSSFFTQSIILYTGSPRVDIELETDWWEDHTLLKVSFPFNVSSDFAVYEIPFASVARPTVRSEPWQKARFEVSVHRWADMSRGGYGVSLLNDGKYGMDTLGNTMRLTIHTSPNWPDPLADRGKHICTYSIYPHSGGWQEAGTSRQAQQLNLPLVGRWLDVFGTGALPNRKSFLTAEEENVDLTCLKVSEDGDGLVLRFVETSGRYAEMTVDMPTRIRSALEVDLLEREIRKADFSGNGLTFRIEPHEVKSFRVTLAR